MIWNWPSFKKICCFYNKNSCVGLYSHYFGISWNTKGCRPLRGMSSWGFEWHCHSFRSQFLNNKWAIVRLQSISVPIGNQRPLFSNHHDCNTEDMNSVYTVFFLESGKLLVLWIFQNSKFLSFHVIGFFWLKCILIECDFCWVWPKTCLYVF